MAQFAGISDYKVGIILVDHPLGSDLIAGDEVLFFNYSGDPDDIGVHDENDPSRDWGINAGHIREVEMNLNCTIGNVFFFDRQGVKWYRWDGGEQPVTSRVEYGTREYGLSPCILSPRILDWEYDTENIISFYRTVEE